MTKPLLPLPRIKRRRQWRRDFAALKARVELSPSMQAYKAANRRHAAADRARKKIARKLAGDTPTPLTAAEFSALNANRQFQALQLGIYTASS